MFAWQTGRDMVHLDPLTEDAYAAAPDTAEIRKVTAAMRRDGSAIRCVHATLVPEDEAMLSVIDATSSELVEQLFARAGVRVDRIVGALAHRNKPDTARKEP